MTTHCDRESPCSMECLRAYKAGLSLPCQAVKWGMGMKDILTVAIILLFLFFVLGKRG